MKQFTRILSLLLAMVLLCGSIPVTGFAKGDIMEGVRALIVDKDKNPRWNPPTLAEVTTEQVAEFFAGFTAHSTGERRQA